HGIEAFLFGGFDHDLNVRSSRFELELELGDFASKIVEGDKGENSDRQPAHGGDERLADAAGDLAGSALQLSATEMDEGAVDPGDGTEQAEERSQGDQSIHDGQKPAGLLEFSAGGDLKRALERRMKMIHAMIDHAHDRVCGVFGDPAGLGKIAGLERG